MTVSTPLMGKAALEKMVGQTAPFGVFDPLGLADDKSEEEILLFREAELAHGRVAVPRQPPRHGVRVDRALGCTHQQPC